MNEVELNINSVKCPLCDFNHNYRVKVKYNEKKDSMTEVHQENYYTRMVIEETVGGSIVKVPVFEVDAFCPKKNSPFRILVDPKIPTEAADLEFSVTLVP